MSFEIKKFDGSFLKTLGYLNETCDRFEIIPIIVEECKKIHKLLGYKCANGGYIEINQ